MTESNWFETVYPEETYAFPPSLTIVLSVPFAQLKADDQLQLSKMLVAIGHSLESVRIVVEPNLDLSQWIEKPRQLIAFQPPPKGIEIYSVTQTPGTTLLFSDSLSVLGTDLSTKKKLWEALRAMFGV